MSNKSFPDPTPPNDVHALKQPAEVPVFNCIVYVSRNMEGGVRARVGNVTGLACTAMSEREALANIIRAFKQHLTGLLQSGDPIVWVDPPSRREPDEQERFIAVHL